MEQEVIGGIEGYGCYFFILTFRYSAWALKYLELNFI